MNKNIIILLSVFTLLSIDDCHAQSLTERFYPKVCKCFEDNYSEENLDLNLFEKCFNLSSSENQKVLEDYIRQELDSTSIKLSHEDEYKAGQKLGQQLFDSLQEPLVNNCDSYYSFLIECKKTTLKNMSKGVSKKEADSLVAIIKSGKWTAETMWKMGSYELGLKNLEKAEDYFNKSLEKNPQYAPSIFFLGIVFDTKGDYQMAIDRYNQIIDQEENSLTFIVKMFLEVAKRKIKE